VEAQPRRVELFSDAVFAIAITLLVLELPFEKVEEGELGHALEEHWASFAAYALAFASIGIAWLHHHAVFDQVARLTRPLLLLNLGLLLTIAFLPFPTQLLGEYIEQEDDARTATLVFAGAWTASSAMMLATWAYVRRAEGVLRRDASAAGARRFERILLASLVGYLAFTLIALASTTVCLVLFAASAALILWGSDYEALEAEPGEATASSGPPPPRG
jgi:uncharacterized membrane protein